MPESARDVHRRAVDASRMPPVQEWSAFPFDGDLRPRALRPPEDEPARDGAGGRSCDACTACDDTYLWTDERWRLTAPRRNGLPVVVLLEPRAHHAEPGDLPDDVAREMGVMLARVERAVRAVGEIGRFPTVNRPIDESLGFEYAPKARAVRGGRRRRHPVTARPRERASAGIRAGARRSGDSRQWNRPIDESPLRRATRVATRPARLLA